MRELEAATARSDDDQLTPFLTGCGKDRLLHTSRHPRNSGNIVVIRGSLMVMIGGWSLSQRVRQDYTSQRLTEAFRMDD